MTTPTISDFVAAFGAAIQPLMATLNNILVPPGGMTPLSALIWVGLLFGPLGLLVDFLAGMVSFGGGSGSGGELSTEEWYAQRSYASSGYSFPESSDPGDAPVRLWDTWGDADRPDWDSLSGDDARSRYSYEDGKKVYWSRW